MPELGVGGDGGGGQMVVVGVGGGGDGGGGGGDGVLHGLSQAEHIVHSIWYLDPSHVAVVLSFLAVTKCSFLDSENTITSNKNLSL